MRTKILPILLGLFIFSFLPVSNTGAQTSTTEDHDKQIIGYFASWQWYKQYHNKQYIYNASNVDYSKYTMLNYSFFGLDKDGTIWSGEERNKPEGSRNLMSEIDVLHLNGKTKDYWTPTALADDGFTGYSWDSEWSGWVHTGGTSGAFPVKKSVEKGLIGFGKENGVKILAAMGGWTLSNNFSAMAADPASRKNFAENCKKLIDEYGFDGIDIDWEYPGSARVSTSPNDKDNFTALVKEIRQAIGEDKILTSCFSANAGNMDDIDWGAVEPYLDYFNIMTYDYHGAFDNEAGHNSALGSNADKEFTIKNTLKELKERNVPVNKIVLGAAFYGRSQIGTGSNPKPGDETKQGEADLVNFPEFVPGSGVIGSRGQAGTPMYSFIHDFIQSNGEDKVFWDEEAQSPYLSFDNTFVSYDNEKSIGEQAKYYKEEGLAGVIIWDMFGDWIVTQEDEDKIDDADQQWLSTPKCTVTTPLVDKINEVFALEEEKKVEYCIPSYEGTSGGYVKFHNLWIGDFHKNDWKGGTYYDLTGPENKIYPYVSGKSYEFRTKNKREMKVTAWIDYNDNGVFEESERILSKRYANSDGKVSSWNITIPEDAETGVHRMRVRGGWYDEGEACGYSKYGQTIDFNVDIISDISEIEYCVPSYNSTGRGYVQFHDLTIGDFRKKGWHGGTYYDLTGEGEQVYEYTKGMSYTFATRNLNKMRVTAWIDFNDNKIFEESERILSKRYANGGWNASSWTFTIPEDAKAGTHRLRVRGGWYDNGKACGYSKFGQTIDFNVNILEGETTKSLTLNNIGQMEEVIDEELMRDTDPVAGDLSFLDIEELSPEELLLAKSEPITSVETACEKYNVVVFPNPTNGNLGIRINNVEDISDIRILSPYGSTVKHLEVSKMINTDISDLAPGVYFIEVVDDLNQSCTQKIIKR